MEEGQATRSDMTPTHSLIHCGILYGTETAYPICLAKGDPGYHTSQDYSGESGQRLNRKVMGVVGHINSKDLAHFMCSLRNKSLSTGYGPYLLRYSELQPIQIW